MSNKKIGNEFEHQLCSLLYSYGFWVHNLAQNSAGQPADIIATKDKHPVLIDCKVCSTDEGFKKNRVESNQDYAMDLWKERGNGDGWFAIKLNTDEIFFMTKDKVKSIKGNTLPPECIKQQGIPFERWINENCYL